MQCVCIYIIENSRRKQNMQINFGKCVHLVKLRFESRFFLQNMESLNDRQLKCKHKMHCVHTHTHKSKRDQIQI